jgi:hypothetical protein
MLIWVREHETTTGKQEYRSSIRKAPIVALPSSMGINFIATVIVVLDQTVSYSTAAPTTYETLIATPLLYSPSNMSLSHCPPT